MPWAVRVIRKVPRGPIWKVSWAGLKDKWPGARGIIQNFTIDNDAMGDMVTEVDLNGQKVEDVEPQVMDVVRGHFRPEFLNRLDEIILFHRLAHEHMAPIVDIQVARVQKLLKDRKIVLDLTEAAKKWLGRVGYDPVYGARPLKRAVQRYVQDPLADMILAGKVPDGAKVAIDEGDGELAMTIT